MYISYLMRQLAFINGNKYCLIPRFIFHLSIYLNFTDLDISLTAGYQRKIHYPIVVYDQEFHISVGFPMYEILNCIFYSFLFISGLYFAGGKFPRDHPETIKRRVVSVFVTGTISMIHILTYIRSYDRPPFQLSSYEFGKLFIRLDGLLEAVIISVILTLVMYFGVVLDDICSGDMLVIFDVQYWKDRIFNWISLRNFVIAPLAEELIFRACVTFHLLPLFSSCVMLCFVSSLFFSLAHFHHVFESVKSGQDLQSAFKTSRESIYISLTFFHELV
ncbi:CAAX prenyl protease [Schistosoma haematobium]|uniref:CAAX prenyl protease 2 n=1 Tax=Schistosoma haematobium TaxID=6185 RepID=A0A922LUH3_SCHHA|nr:CAAX prenyl protease [Schistosoma haematobium]KAH9594132.1 CAAX prenyl protease [Schistosoma haematobium]